MDKYSYAYGTSNTPPLAQATQDLLLRKLRIYNCEIRQIKKTGDRKHRLKTIVYSILFLRFF